MPEELWELAVAAARNHGVYAVCRSLGLNYNNLRARVGMRDREALQVSSIA